MQLKYIYVSFLLFLIWKTFKSLEKQKQQHYKYLFVSFTNLWIDS